jgi:hypothetical protein
MKNCGSANVAGERPGATFRRGPPVQPARGGYFFRWAAT